MDDMNLGTEECISTRCEACRYWNGTSCNGNLQDFTGEIGWDKLQMIGTGWQTHDIECANEIITEVLKSRGWNEYGIDEFLDHTELESGYWIMMAILDTEDR